MKHSVYKTTNNINGKYYLGKHSSEDPNDSYLGSGVALNKAIKKYGRENFTKQVLKVCETLMEAEHLEKLYVEKHLGDRNCYNMTEGGKGSWAHTWDSNLRKLRAAEALKGKNGFKGKKHTTETRAKISQNNARKIKGEELHERIQDYIKDDGSYGQNSRLAKKWNMTSQAAGRFLKQHNFKEYNNK